MKVLLHTSHQSWVEGSGVGRAIYHQKKALEKNGIKYYLTSCDQVDNKLQLISETKEKF